MPCEVARRVVASRHVGAVGADFHAVGVAGERFGSETGRAAPRVCAEDDCVAALGGCRDDGDRVAEHAREVVRHLRGGEARGGRGVRRHHHFRASGATTTSAFAPVSSAADSRLPAQHVRRIAPRRKEFLIIDFLSFVPDATSLPHCFPCSQAVKVGHWGR